MGHTLLSAMRNYTHALMLSLQHDPPNAACPPTQSLLLGQELTHNSKISQKPTSQQLSAKSGTAKERAALLRALKYYLFAAAEVMSLMVPEKQARSRSRGAGASSP